MKRYFTLVNLVLLTVAIYFGVTAFYRYLSTQMAAGPSFTPPPAAADTSFDQQHRPLASYQPIADRNLFKTGENKPPEDAPKAEEPETVEPLKPTELNLKLWGTVSGDAPRAYAVIEDPQERRQNLYRVGDTIQNASVREILREKVILVVDGKREVLEMEKRDISQARGPSPRPSNPIQRLASANPSGGRDDIRIDRQEIDQAINNVNNLMRQAKIRPHFKNGKPDGLTLTRVRPNSIFTKLGLRSGDIITGVDGQQIQSVDDALRFYRSLKSGSNVQVEVRRRGQPHIIDYNIE